MHARHMQAHTPHASTHACTHIHTHRGIILIYTRIGSSAVLCSSCTDVSYPLCGRLDYRFFFIGEETGVLIEIMQASQ